MFSQLLPGRQRQYRLPQFVIVTTVNSVRSPAAVRRARLRQLLVSHVDQ